MPRYVIVLHFTLQFSAFGSPNIQKTLHLYFLILILMTKSMSAKVRVGHTRGDSLDHPKS